MKIKEALRRIELERAYKERLGREWEGSDGKVAAKLAQALDMAMKALAGEDWFPAETAPADGTPFLACGDGTWDEHYSGLAPATCRFRTYHPNQPGKKTFRWEDGRPASFKWWRKMPSHPNLRETTKSR